MLFPRLIFLCVATFVCYLAQLVCFVNEIVQIDIGLALVFIIRRYSLKFDMIADVSNFVKFEFNWRFSTKTNDLV
jgi:uncharacterized membrane protein YjgN (DUF898 family)